MSTDWDAGGLAGLEEQLEGLVDEARARFDLPALAVGLTNGGELVRFAGSGIVDDAGRQPDEHTGWRVASITKTVTTTAILQLRDRGLLDLDDPLARHLPEFDSVGERGGPRAAVTLRRMLLHQSGLPTETPLPTWTEPAFPTMAEILSGFWRTEIAIEPGTRFKYSNLAFGLLGEVVSRRSGQPYAQYVKEQILDPLGMEEGGFDRHEGDLAGRMARSFIPGLEDGPLRPAPYVPLRGIEAAGQLITSVGDLARWVGAQMPGAGLLTETTLAEMQAPTDVERTATSRQSLGWEVTRVRGESIHGHGGGLFGFASYAGFHVPSRTGLIVLTNLWPVRSAASRLAMELYDRLFGGAGAWPALAWSAPVDDPEVAPEAEAEPFIGPWFAEPAFPARIVARRSGLHLEPADGGEYSLHAPTALEVAGADRLLALDGRPAGEFLAFRGRGTGSGAFERFGLGGFDYRRTGPPHSPA